MINENTCWTIAPLSSTLGGFLLYGLSNGTASASATFIGGAQGHASPTGPNTIFRVVKTSGGTTFQALAATEIGWKFQNSSTDLITILGSGNTGFGISPTAVVHLKVGTAKAGTAPLKFTTGTVTTAAVAAQMEYDNTFHLTNSDATRRHVVLAPNTTKTTAGAPLANDGYIVMNISGTDFKIMTTA